MITKIILQSIISKYYLGGMIESTKWEIKDKQLIIKFMSPNQDMLGKVTYKNFPLENTDLVIFNTSQFNKLINVTHGDLTLNVAKTKNLATRLDISDSQFDVNYALADTMMAKKVADVEEPDQYEIEIKLDPENIAALIKSKNAIGDDDTMILETSINPIGDSIMLFTFGENTDYSNKITYSIPIESISNMKLPFSSNTLKEILSANKDMKEGNILINSEGLMKLKFVDKENLSTEYFMIRKADL